MKNIQVKLLHHTPEKILKAAMSKPYKQEIHDSKLRDVVLKYCIGRKHGSVLEHIVFNFDVVGISRLCLQELARHRIASLTVESTRFSLGKIIRGIQKNFNRKQENKNQNENFKLDHYFINPYKEETYDYGVLRKFFHDCIHVLELLSQSGNDKMKYALVEAFRTQLIWTVNARSLRNFLTLRQDSKTSKPHFEIKLVAWLVLQELKETEMWYLFKDLDFYLESPEQ